MHPNGEDDILITHASPREPVWEYILTPTTALENFAFFDEAICFVGHTHKPAIFRWHLPEEVEPEHTAATVQYLQPVAGTGVQLVTSPRQRLIVNPGSVG